MSFSESKNNFDSDSAHLIELAKRIKASSMESVVVFALEASKPFSYIASQVMLAFEPLVGIFLNTTPYNQIAYLLADRNKIEYLLKLLEGTEDNCEKTEDREGGNKCEDRVQCEEYRAD